MTYQGKTMVERLGFDRGEKVLIINADDAGMCHTVNEATISGMRDGLVTSATLMNPCPWALEFAELSLAENLPCGVHLTTTSEWKNYRWGPLSSRDRVDSLLDDFGYFYPDEKTFYQLSKIEQVELEFRAQVEFAIRLGLKPTHLDSHMGVYHWKEEYFEIVRSICVEHRMTLRVGYPPRAERLQAEGWATADRCFFDTHDVPAPDKKDFYLNFFNELMEPGFLYELVLHLGRQTEELAAITDSAPGREADLLLFTEDEQIREAVEKNNIHMVGYDDLIKLQRRDLGWDAE